MNLIFFLLAFTAIIFVGYNTYKILKQKQRIDTVVRDIYNNRRDNFINNFNKRYH